MISYYPLEKTKKQIFSLYFLSLIPIYIKGYLNPFIIQYPILYWLVEILVWILFPIYLFDWCGRRRLQISYEKLGYHTKLCGEYIQGGYISTTVILIPIIFISYALLRKLSSHIIFDNYLYHGFSYGDLIPAYGIERYIVLWFYSISAGFVEETQRSLCRLLFSNSFEDSIRYVLFSAAFFSLLHWHQGVQHIFLTFCLGVLFASLYLYFKNIWPIVVNHVLLDLFLLS